MSRLAKKSIPIPAGVTIKEESAVLLVRGPKGEKKLAILPLITVHRGEEGIRIASEKDSAQAKANSGTMWALIRNAIQGVTAGFQKELELEGVGYRAAMEGESLVLHLGFVNPIRVTPPSGVTVTVQKNIIIISGVDKELVGRAAAEIRALKKPEPYKGKGIHYVGEVIRRKAGKKAASTATA